MTDATSDPNAAAIQAVAGALLPLLQAMDAMTWARQRLDPYAMKQLADAIAAQATPLREALPAFRAADLPEALGEFAAAVRTAADATLKAYDGLDAAKAAEGFDALRLARRAVRAHLAAERAIYPLAALSPPVSQYFLPPERREDAALLARLDEAADRPMQTGGVRSFPGPEDAERGGFACYVPEYLDPAAPAPVCLALHGGRGNGPDYLWSWLPAARAMGVVLIAPTARGDTWAIMGEDVDSPNIARIMDDVAAVQALDRSRVLMTGMSDGGTFSYVAGLLDGGVATHLAPFAASFHPMLLEFVSADRLANLPIRLTHGARDWMFQIDVARMAAEAFRGREARLVYRELPDRAHVFPQDECLPALEWFLNDGEMDAS